ncbi:MAG: radical SAM protein [Candidatus Schekmanbacteria bacterium]|nr:radical SAM protein [Candidatus Schekmanbacteria bacterium]
MKLFKKLRLFYKWTISKEKTTAAIDVTSRCNLRCRHCYWWKEESPREMDDEEMLAFMKKLRQEGIVAAFLYGGEPLLRPNICEAASKIFDFTLIFTNGTFGLPDIKCQWVLSLDGPAEIHDKIRGAGVFQEVIGSLQQATRPPIIHMTISQLNKQHIGAFLHEMGKKEIKRHIKGIGFSFYTPHRGIPEEDFFIPLDERDRLVDELLAYRKQYGFSLGLTDKMGYQFKQSGGFSTWNSRDKCPVKDVCICYKSDGTRKPCTYGVNADCSRCGCASVAAFRAAIGDWDAQSLIILNSISNGCC